MNKRGSLWIVPDENQILQPVFFRKIENGISHTSEIRNFVNIYEMGLEIDETDYHEGPCTVAKLGNLVIKSDDDVSQLIFYIPEKITNNQIQFILNNQFLFSKYQVVGGYSLKHLDDNGVVWKKIHGLNEITMECNLKNIKYQHIENKKMGGK